VAVSWALARAGLGGRRVAALGLALVLALGLAVSLASLEAARRTERAYPSYLRSSNAGDVVINPSLVTDRTAALIGSTPGVQSYVSDSMLTASLDDGAPRTRAQIESDDAGVLMRLSTDGRFVDQDRPIVQEGRMVGRGAEIFLGVDMAELLDLRVGDTVPISFWPNSFIGAEASDELIEPIGRSRARVVGTGIFAEEVLTDELYPRAQVVITPEVASRFDCIIDQPAADDPRSVEQFLPALIPADCATSYRYYSIQAEGGDDGVARVSEELAARFAAASESLPAGLREANVRYEVITSGVTAEQRDRVQRSLNPSVRALQLFGLGAGLCAVAVGLLLAARAVRRLDGESGLWRALGATRVQRAAGVGLPLVAGAVIGLGAAAALGWLASGLGPVGSARVIDDGGRLGLSAPVVLVVIGTAGLVMLAGIAATAMAASRSAPAAGDEGARRSPVADRLGRPSVALGVRAGTRGPGGRFVLAAAVVAVAAVLATAVFTTSLDAFVSKPERYGWPYDVGVTINFGYGGATDRSAIASSLDRPEVRHWGLVSIDISATVKGETLPAVGAVPGFDALRLPVIEGAAPVGADEIAIGAETADELGLRVGSRTRVETPYGARDAVVRGIVVLPPLGAFQSGRASLGTGVLFSPRFLAALIGDAETNVGVGAGAIGDALPAFVGVDLQPGVDAEEFLADLDDELPSWAVNGVRPLTYASPVRPPTVGNVAAMRAVPVSLAGVLALAMAVALVLSVAMGTRARRRELAVLRALGFVGRQLRATVRWQALVVVGVGLVVGLPVGVAIGRVVYRLFATDLGVRPQPVVSLPFVLVFVAAAVLTATLAAAGPGRRAARVSTAAVLRDE
jgi:ABC-type lipoprotein release transport system permease subunit